MTRHELSILTWSRLARSGHQGEELTQKLVLQIIKTVFEVITECLLRGELVRIDKFGLFHPRAYASHRGWSHTQQKMADTRPFMKVHFTMGQAMKRIAKEILVREKKEGRFRP
jgi:nucleoid DNA-binding protein